jgi:hypothetical protein
LRQNPFLPAPTELLVIGKREAFRELFNAVVVLVLTASILGPVLTEHLAPRLLEGVLEDNGSCVAGGQEG